MEIIGSWLGSEKQWKKQVRRTLQKHDYNAVVHVIRTDYGSKVVCIHPKDQPCAECTGPVKAGGHDAEIRWLRDPETDETYWFAWVPARPGYSARRKTREACLCALERALTY